MQRSTIGIWYMVAATFGWGLSYLLNQIGMRSLQASNLVFLRFAIGCLLLFTLFWRTIRAETSWKMIRRGAIVGFLLYLNFLFTLEGLKTTDTGVAGIMLGSTVIWTQLFQAVYDRRWPNRAVLLASLLAFAGICLLSWNGRFVFSWGDFNCVMAGLVSGILIVSIGQLMPGLDATAFSIWECAWCGIFGLAGMLLWEHPVFPQSGRTWLSIFLLGVICSALCFVAQFRAQKLLDAARIGILFALEPLFALLIGVVFLGERLNLAGTCGCILILSGVLFTNKA